jgi:hypothetical protein
MQDRHRTRCESDDPLSEGYHTAVGRRPRVLHRPRHRPTTTPTASKRTNSPPTSTGSARHRRLNTSQPASNNPSATASLPTIAETTLRCSSESTDAERRLATKWPGVRVPLRPVSDQGLLLSKAPQTPPTGPWSNVRRRRGGGARRVGVAERRGGMTSLGVAAPRLSAGSGRPPLLWQGRRARRCG